MSAEGSTVEVSPTQDWVTRIAAGDAAAEADFARHFLAAVRSLVRRQSRPLEPEIDDMAQDVLQSTLLALRRGRLRDPSTLPAYLRGTVEMITRAHYRKQHRRGEDRMEALDDNIASAEDPRGSLDRGQLASLVHRLIGELTVDRDRQLLERFYIQEQSKEVVCAELGIASEHFHRVTYRARERLRHLLEAAGIAG